MALQRFTIDGYGQIEPNNVTFTRDGFYCRKWDAFSS